MLKKKTSLGFTLIELLMVVAIIGILTSIVLTFLATARNRGKDAGIQAQLLSLKTQAEIFGNNAGYATSTTNYNNLFTGNNTWASTDGNVQSILSGITKQSTTTTAGSSATAWAAQAKLNATASTTYVCVDNRGTLTTSGTAMVAGATICP